MPMTFSPDKLLQGLSDLKESGNYCVALSGGLDSVVLLHSLVHLRDAEKLPITQNLSAIHINHQLNAGADNWQKFCEELCERWDVPLLTEKVEVRLGSGEGLENAARQARYTAFEALLTSNDALLMAHHLDDQMETLLLRLMRGSGPGGLAGIPTRRKLGKIQMYRPLLTFSREQLKRYATQTQLQWQEDDSNQNLDFDRNFCRHELLPLIQNRWPSYRESWDKTLQLAGEADSLLTELARADLETAIGRDALVIDLTTVLDLSPPRQRNVFRLWLLEASIPNCGWNLLQKLTTELIPAAADATAVFQGEGFQIRRFRNQLYLLQDLASLELPRQTDWDARRAPCLELGVNGALSATGSTGFGLKLKEDDVLAVHYRKGGEHCQFSGRPTKSLKKLMQEQNLPPWLRDRQPLLYINQTLACVPGIGVCEEFEATGAQAGLLITWQQPDLRYKELNA
jgi:tRNA(Ile)-lysidine synthase